MRNARGRRDDRPDRPTDSCGRGRGRGDLGSAVVAALVLLFSFTAGGIIWLSRDVNRSVSNRSAAQSIAFQAARAGAQQVALGSLRGGSDSVVLDEEAAVQTAVRIAAQLFDEYDVAGPAPVISVNGDTVTATITLTDIGGDVTVTGSAQARTEP